MHAPDGTEVWPIHPKEGWEGRWSISPETWKKIKGTNEVKWELRPSGWTPYRLEIADDIPTMPLPSIIDDMGQNRQAKAQLNQILGTNHGFDTPKPIDLIEILINLATDTNSIVMDSFAGSGTTGHAVLSANAKDEGKRKFILVEIEESVARSITQRRLSNAALGYRSLSRVSEILFEKSLSLSDLKNISNIVDEIDGVVSENRDAYSDMKREMTDGTVRVYGIRSSEEDVPGLGGGFRFCRLGAALFDEFGDVAHEVDFPDLAAHIFFSETGVPIPHRAASELLGAYQGRAVYLLFDAASPQAPREAAGNVLTPDRLAVLPAPPKGFEGLRVVYAEGCTVSADRLKAQGVLFKQIPYQVEGV